MTPQFSTVLQECCKPKRQQTNQLMLERCFCLVLQHSIQLPLS